LKIFYLILTSAITTPPEQIQKMTKGKRKAKAEEGEGDEKKDSKKARLSYDFFHDKPE